jgi:hypothetical protein
MTASPIVRAAEREAAPIRGHGPPVDMPTQLSKPLTGRQAQLHLLRFPLPY